MNFKWSNNAIKTKEFGSETFLKLVLIYYICGSATVVAGFVYFIFGLYLSLWQIFCFIVATPFFLLVVFAADTFTIAKTWKPVKIFFEKNENELTQEEVKAALTRSIDFPLLTFLRIAFIHFPVTQMAIGISLVLLNLLMKADFQIWQFAMGILLGFIFSPLHGIVEYYYVKKLMLPVVELIEKQMLDVSIDLPIKYIKIQKSFLIVLTSILFIPTLIVASTLLIKSYTLIVSLGVTNYEYLFYSQLVVWALLLVAISFLTTFGIGYVLSDEINFPLQITLSKLNKIKAGNYHEPLFRSNAVEFAELFSNVYQLSKSLHEKEVIKHKFGKYVPNKVILDKILSESYRLKGEEKIATILFCDIQSFTEITEHLGPEKTVDMLNDFFSKSVNIVNAHGGMVDKYIGDAFMAIFGENGDSYNHAEAALHAAQELQDFLTASKSSFSVGIGINTGKVILGNIGSEDRLEYTAIGDTVNVASRIESLTRKYQVNILVSNSTYQDIIEKEKLQSLGKVHVKGVSNAIELFSPKAAGAPSLN